MPDKIVKGEQAGLPNPHTLLHTALPLFLVAAARPTCTIC